MLSVVSSASAIFSLLAVLLSCASADDHGKGSIPLGPPTDVRNPYWPVGQTLTQDMATVEWEAPPTADRYILTLNEVEGEERILNAEITNVETTRFVFLLLSADTTYEVIIKAVRVEADGSVTVSEPSEPFQLTTLAECKGGMIHDYCGAHCIATCEDQIPFCSRECRPGCACPRRTKPFLHDGLCITKKQCEELGTPIIEVLRRPKNLKVHPLKNSMDVVFTWDEVEGASFYTVIVMLADGTEIQKIDSKISFVVISGLKQKVKYKFRVQAKWIVPKVTARGLSPTPEAPTVSDIKQTSFLVRWEDFENADSYTVRVYRKQIADAIGVFSGLKETYVTIQGLVPSTEYEVTVAVITDEIAGKESGRTLVQTTYADDDRSYVPEEEFTVTMPTTTTPTTTTAPQTTSYVATCEDKRSAALAYQESLGPDAAHGDLTISECDSSGNYRSIQCSANECYCVERKSGDRRPGTEFADKDSKYAIKCNGLGDYKIDPIEATVTAVNTRMIKVVWEDINDQNLVSYTVKVYTGFTSEFVKSVSEIETTEVEIGGLKPGFPYIVVVIALNKAGETSDDKVKGSYILLPYLDPPTNLIVQRESENALKLSWRQSPDAEHYSIKVFENGATTSSRTYENVTSVFQVIPYNSINDYKLAVRASAVRQIQGRGRPVLVYSKEAEVNVDLPEVICRLPALEVIFGLDVSGSMTSTEYQKMKDFFSKLSLGIGPVVNDVQSKSGRRVAAVKYSGVARTIFRFHRFSNERNLIGGVNFVKQTKNPVLNLGNVLNFIHTNFFTGSNDDDQRDGVQTVVILFFGGKSTDVVATFAPSLRTATNVIAVGVRGKASYADISVAASQKTNRIMLNNYDEMDQAYEKVMKVLCTLK